MFQKKQYIFSESMGVCQVSDIVKLSPDNSSPILYYVLKSAENKDKVSYIPVEHHQVLLRELISGELAEKILGDPENYSKLEVEEAKFVQNPPVKKK